MSIDLSTKYLGLTLAHPLMVGASPIVDDMDQVRRAEDAGAAAFVMHSLFEEQINLENDTFEELGTHGQSFAEAMTYQPRPRARRSVRRPQRRGSHLPARLRH